MEEMSCRIFLQEEEIKEMMTRFHFEEKDTERLRKVCRSSEEAQQTTVFVKLLSKDSKERLSFVEYENYAVVAATLGEKIDCLQDKYSTEGLIWESYAAECAAMEMLAKLYLWIREKIEEKSGLYPGYFSFIGDKYPLSTIKEIFSLWKQEFMRYNDSYIIKPKKSVVLITGLSQEKENCAFKICDFCTNRACTNRQAIEK